LFKTNKGLKHTMTRNKLPGVLNTGISLYHRFSQVPK
jgi:hypothetical protein